jgi:alanyl-tRNA synthetase
MTDRLYYDRPYLLEFDATVRAVSERGDQLVVTLDQTAFYPTSGGQPFDLGSLGPLRVIDVEDQEDGTIAHVVDTPDGTSLTPGESVHGVVDRARRFDHMQQHTGQHVLSAAFDKLSAVRTVSFHLGASVSTIDLARETTPDEIAAAESEANRIVWEDRRVTIRYATPEEAARLPLRKESARGGMLRLIDVEAFDLSACGGTHVERTGSIGLIAVASWERFKGGQRLEFLCGGRALGRFRSLRDVVAAGGRSLSVLPQELPAAIERIQAEAKEQRRVASVLQSELARYRAEELAASAEKVRLPPSRAERASSASLAEASGEGGKPDDIVNLVLQAVDGDASTLKGLAAAIASRPGYLVVLVSTSRPALVVVARSADITFAANQILLALTTAFGGRGGGKPELAQGGGLDAPSETILSAARQAILAKHDSTVLPR